MDSQERLVDFEARDHFEKMRESLVIIDAARESGWSSSLKYLPKNFVSKKKMVGDNKKISTKSTTVLITKSMALSPSLFYKQAQRCFFSILASMMVDAN